MSKKRFNCVECKDTGWRTVRRGTLMDIERPCMYCDLGEQESERFRKEHNTTTPAQGERE